MRFDKSQPLRVHLGSADGLDGGRWHPNVQGTRRGWVVMANRRKREGAIQRLFLPNAGDPIRLIAPFISCTAATALTSPHFVTRIISLCRRGITQNLALSITIGPTLETPTLLLLCLLHLCPRLAASSANPASLHFTQGTMRRTPTSNVSSTRTPLPLSASAVS